MKGGDFLKTLVLSDIHANEPALHAVLNDALPCDRVVFLGDLANFGPHPAQCVELLQTLNPICIMGNHDEQIVSETPKHFWDKWSKQQLNMTQQDWIREFKHSFILDNHILLVHGSYSVDYDILPNTPDKDIKAAFSHLLTPEIDQVWFGHYHYQIDRIIDGVTYHCIRPVGHHRDKDTRASYSIYENNTFIHKRVEYDIEKTIKDIRHSNVLGDLEPMFIDLIRNAFHAEALKKDLEQMKKNEKAE